MSSGIFAVANIGHFRCYVGPAHELRKRWPPIMQALSQGTFGHPALEAEWQQLEGERRFTFHRAADLAEAYDIVNLDTFFADIGQL